MQNPGYWSQDMMFTCTNKYTDSKKKKTKKTLIITGTTKPVHKSLSEVSKVLLIQLVCSSDGCAWSRVGTHQLKNKRTCEDRSHKRIKAAATFSAHKHNCRPRRKKRKKDTFGVLLFFFFFIFTLRDRGATSGLEMSNSNSPSSRRARSPAQS